MFIKKLFFVLFLVSNITQAKIKIKTYFEKIENGYAFYADNDEVCPVSIKVNLKLTNLKSSNGNDKVFVIPANSRKFRITTLNPIKRGKYKFSSSTRYNLGLDGNIDFDKDFNYFLPYERGEAFMVCQGYNGSFSHQHKNALDFTMPVGTNISAVRNGLVVKVIDQNNRGCSTKECIKFNNIILLYHEDGTFAEYAHISYKGSLVKVGERVKQGQVIAKSGNTGWSTGPHLHLVIFNQDINERKTIRTKFKINKGDKLELLREKEIYLKNY